MTPEKTDSNPRHWTTPTLTRTKSKIRTHDHALHPPLTPKCKIFEPTTMHYTTIDPQNDKNSNPRPCTTPPLMTPEKTRIRTHDHALHHHWPPKCQIRTHPTTMHYTTIDPKRQKILKLSFPYSGIGREWHWRARCWSYCKYDERE
jgi:hypothetical protein